MTLQLAPTLSTAALEPWLWLAADVLLGFAVLRQANAYLALRARTRLAPAEAGLPTFGAQLQLVKRRVEQLVARGQYAEAVRVGYLETLANLITLSAIQPPLSATHRELLTQDLVGLPESLRDAAVRLYQVYEPHRYGGASSSAAEASQVLDVLTGLEDFVRVKGG